MYNVMFNKPYNLDKTKYPWTLENTTWDRRIYIQTENLERNQTVNLVFRWWTMRIYIDDTGMCHVLNVWYMN